jgi:hypothetical protein
MSRSISLVINGDADVRELDYNVARALGESIDGKHGGIRMGGCGMDMGFALVYSLSRALFPGGYGCIGKGEGEPRHYCPSSDHSNGDRDYTPHGAETSDARGADQCWHWHRDGGYALRHRWL